jgi:hypothetical protein
MEGTGLMNAKSSIARFFSDIQRLFGAWFFVPGVILFFITSEFLGTLTGAVLFGISAAAVSADGILYFLYNRSRPEKGFPPLFISWALFILSAAFYFLRAEVLILSDSPSALLIRLRLVTLVLFLFTAGASMVFRIFIGLSESAAHGSDSGIANDRMKQYRLTTFLSILIALPIFFILNYSTIIQNPSFDLTFRTFTVSDQAKSLLHSLDRDVEIYVFLPVQQAVKGNTKAFTAPELYRIADDVKIYTEQYPLASSRIKVTFKNAELETDRTGDFSGINNGTIVIRAIQPEISIEGKPYTERKIYVQSERDLDQLERDLVRAIVQTASPKKKVYFPSLNDEKYTVSDKTLSRNGIEEFKEALRFHNFDVRSLGISEGWPSAIPEDADLLVIAGPKIAYSAESKKAVIEYLKKGGKVMAAIDPEGKETLDWLLKSLTNKFTWKKGNLTNVKNLSGIIVTSDTSGHRITESLSNSVSKGIPLVFPTKGYFELISVPPSTVADQKVSGASGKVPSTDTQPSPGKAAVVKTTDTDTIDFNGKEEIPAVYSPAASFIDLNKNSSKDNNEKNIRAPLFLVIQKNPDKVNGAAVSGNSKSDTVKTESGKNGSENPATNGKPLPTGDKTGVAVISSDADWLSDLTQAFPIQKRNLNLAVDSALWLTENPMSSALIAETRESRRIQVNDDLKMRNMVFGIVLFPLGTSLALFIGIRVYRRRRIWREEEN